MNGFALLLLCLTPAAEPVEIANDAYEIQTQTFALPTRVVRTTRGGIKQIRLYVSVDNGRSWVHKQDYAPTIEEILYTAPTDGLYWFAVQALHPDGRRIPAGEYGLQPAMKVYVNTKLRPVKVQRKGETREYCIMVSVNDRQTDLKHEFDIGRQVAVAVGSYKAASSRQPIVFQGSRGYLTVYDSRRDIPAFPGNGETDSPSVPSVIQPDAWLSIYKLNKP